MSQIAKWGKKTWNVSAVKVQGVEDLNFSFTQTADNNTSTEENKLTNQRGKELFPLKFSTVLCAGAGTPDIRAEIEDWQSLVTKVDYFSSEESNSVRRYNLEKFQYQISSLITEEIY